MSRTGWVVVGLVVVIAGLVIANFFMTHERVKKDVRQPPSGEARKNPFLALERTLGEMGVDATTRQTADKPDRTTRIYLLTDRQRDFSPEQIDSWRAWVEEGGHLLLPAPPAGQTESQLLEAVGVRHVEPEEGDDGDGDGSSDNSTDESNGGRTFETTAQPASLAGWRADDTDWSARNEAGDRVAFSAPAGRGRVTMLASAEHLKNHMLGKAENARFAWETVTLGAMPGEARVAIVRFSTNQGWIGYAAAHTWPLLVVLGVILLFALNAGRWQFGSELPTPPSKRRSRVEHIRATGEFLWEHGAASRLLGASRAALIDGLARRRPSLPDLTRRERRKVVRDELDLESDAARMIFDDRDHLSESQLTARIELMERYRRTL